MENNEETKLVQPADVNLNEVSEEEEEAIFKITQAYKQKIAQGNSATPAKAAKFTGRSIKGLFDTVRNPEKLRKKQAKINAKYAAKSLEFNYYLEKANKDKAKIESNTGFNQRILTKSEKKNRIEALKLGKKLARIGVQLTKSHAKANGQNLREIAVFDRNREEPHALKVPYGAKNALANISASWYFSHVFRNEVYAAVGVQPRFPFIGMSPRFGLFPLGLTLPFGAKYTITSSDPAALDRLNNCGAGVVKFPPTEQEQLEQILKHNIAAMRNHNAEMEKQKQAEEAAAEKKDDKVAEQPKESETTKAEDGKVENQPTATADVPKGAEGQPKETPKPPIGKYDNPLAVGQAPTINQTTGQATVPNQNIQGQGAKYLENAEPQTITDALAKGLPVPITTVTYQQDPKKTYNEQRIISEIGKLLNELSTIKSSVVEPELKRDIEKYTITLRGELGQIVGINLIPSPQVTNSTTIVYSSPVNEAEHLAKEIELNAYWHSPEQERRNAELNQKAQAYQLVMNGPIPEKVVREVAVSPLQIRMDALNVITSNPKLQRQATLMDIAYDGPVHSTNSNLFNARFMSWNELMETTSELSVKTSVSDTLATQYEEKIFSAPAPEAPVIRAIYQDVTPLSQTVGVRYTENFFDTLLRPSVVSTQEVRNTVTNDEIVMHATSSVAQRNFAYVDPGLGYRITSTPGQVSKKINVAPAMQSTLMASFNTMMHGNEMSSSAMIKIR